MGLCRADCGCRIYYYFVIVNLYICAERFSDDCDFADYDYHYFCADKFSDRPRVEGC